jgi:EmrB/QacA subfamily drug resistance transporter
MPVPVQAGIDPTVTMEQSAGVATAKRRAVAAGAGTHNRATYIVLCTSVSAYSLLQSLVLPVLPTIQASLHTSQNAVTWVLTAYLLSASIFTPILGRLGDMWGKERMLVIALAALAVGSAMAALSHSIGLMIVARAIQGVGGGVLPLSFGIIRDEFPKPKVAGAVGVIAGLTAVGGAVGVVLAGPIVSALDYHWLFWIPMIALIAAGIAAHIVVPASPIRLPGRLNWPAVVLLSGWLVALLIAVSEAPTWGWGSARVLGLLVAAVVLGVAWVVVESRSAQPLIDMAMMRIPVVRTTNLVALLFGVGLYATFAFVPEFLQTSPSDGYGFGSSVTHSGLILLPLGTVMFAFSLASGRLTTWFGAKALLVVGSTVSIAPVLILAVAHGRQWEFGVAMALEGVGFGLAFAAMSSLVVEGVPPSQTGVASGMNANIRTIGGSIGAAVVSSVITASARPDGVPRVSGYVHGFELLTVAAIGAALASILVPSARHVLTREELHDAMPHAELGIVAGGTLFGSDPE